MGWIREVKESEYPDAMETVWKTFLEFDAPDYGMEGINNFRKFLTDETLYKMYLNGYYRVIGYFEDDRIEGVASIRNSNHISLLFVNRRYQKRGIGTSLLNYLCGYCVEYEDQEEITVNSSPYAVDFYRKYGFRETGPARESKGITYTPMRHSLKKSGYPGGKV